MLAVSLLSPRERAPAGAAWCCCGAGRAGRRAMFTGAEINGARRWLSIGGHSFQPSEFAKPAFVVVSAWLFAEAQARPDMPALPLAIALCVALRGPARHAARRRARRCSISVRLGAHVLRLGAAARRARRARRRSPARRARRAYAAFRMSQARIDRFFDPLAGRHFSQTDRAMQSFTEGGFLGRGPGEGTIKTVLPDAHTDFIFAVVGEEYGVRRLPRAAGAVRLRRAARAAAGGARARRRRRASPSSGSALLFGLQALINMGVNVGLLPAKGMTLPFISAGGSSMLAISLTLGMLLALTRRRADPPRVKKPRLVPTIG